MPRTRFVPIAPGRAAVTVARLDAIEIAFHWRWLPVLLLGTALLGHAILPLRFPAWAPGAIWLTSAAAVLLGEAALLLHELSHALAARRRGQGVQRIVFHGFVAETILGPEPASPDQEALIALVGPATNVAIACLVALVRACAAVGGPLDVLLLLGVLGNLGMAAMSLVPLGSSDGRRAWRALRTTKRARP